MANKVEFAERLVVYRGRREWSQSELAEIMGVHRNTIVSWESGTIPSRGVVVRLTDELLLSKEERKGFLEAAGFSIEHWPAEYWNVPYKQNPYFIGRETILQSLRQRFVTGAKITAVTQSISGLGGIGKTQVAVEYAHCYGEHYEAVLWIAADSLEVATAALLHVATQVLGLPEQQEAEQQVAGVKRWLQKHHNWLLILDNVEDPEAILSVIVPSKHQGNVLITTRQREVGPLAHSEVLPLLSEEEGALLLLRRAKRITLQASAKDATPADALTALELCHLMDGLPLALDQAGAYIAENGCSLQRYRDLYKQSWPKLLQRRGVGNHPDSVLKTFSLSWEQIRQRNVLAGKALTFCAFLAPDQIPEQLVQAGIMLAEMEKILNEVELDETLGLLYRYSLIERADQTLSLHRLVQEVMQEILSEEEQYYWMKISIIVVNNAFPNGNHETWSLCEFLLPHALVCSVWTSVLRQKKSSAVGAWLLSATGRYLCGRARYEDAEPLLLQALSIIEEQLGAFHPETAVCLNNLASLYEKQGRYEDAEPPHKQAFSIREEQLGTFHPETAGSLNNLASLYEKQGRYEDAEPLYKQALVISEEQLGPSHPQTATSLNNLALFYANLGHYKDAEPLYQRSLFILEEQLGASHPDTAITLNNLAELYRAQRRYRDAEPLYKQALAISEEQLGSSHPETAIQLNNLALFYVNQGCYGDAKPLYQRALSILEEQLGPSHPDTMNTLSNLAGLYYQQGCYSEAEPLYWLALTRSRMFLGSKHPQTQQIKANCLVFLSDRYTNGNMNALLQLLRQRELDDIPDGESSQ